MMVSPFYHNTFPQVECDRIVKQMEEKKKRKRPAPEWARA